MDFKGLWKSYEGGQAPDFQEIRQKAEKYKKQNRQKAIAVLVTVLLTITFIAFIGYHYQSDIITTKLGMIFSVLAILSFGVIYSQSIPLLFNLGFEMNNSQYLSQFQRLKAKQEFIQTKAISGYFILLTLGLVLYMIEFVNRMPMVWAIASYVMLLAWVGLNWFYFRRKMIKQQTAQIDQLINQLKRIESQLDE